MNSELRPGSSAAEALGELPSNGVNVPSSARHPRTRERGRDDSGFYERALAGAEEVAVL
jgi:hypothetical protein